MSFSQPSAGGDQFDAKDHNGRLLIVYPKSFSAETPTAHGISPSADVDIVIVDAVDATGKPLYFQNARLFGNLAKSVSRDLGGAVLGRLGQVPTQRGNPAWVLQSYTDQDAAMAAPADAAYRAGQFKQPENPMAQSQQAAPAAPQGYGATASPAPQQQWQAPPQSPAGPAPQAVPGQWPATAQPPASPATPPPAQQQWNAAPAAPSAPAQPQWQQGAPAPTGQPAAPAPAPAPAGGPPADPALLAHLANYGINLPPTTPHDEALAVAATLPQ